MKNRKLIFALILSLAFNFAFLGALGYRMLERREYRKTHSRYFIPHRRFLKKKVGLPPEKMEKLEQIHEDFLPRIYPIRHQLMHERNLLGGLLVEEETDTFRIEEKLSRIGELQIQIEKEVVYQLLRERAVLGPEEREQYLNMVVRRLGKKLGPPMGHPGKKESFKRFDECKEINQKTEKKGE